MIPLLHKKSLADAIRARGFRKWYEGRLIEGHLHLITAFLCLIAVLGAIKQGGPYNTLVNSLWLLSVAMGLGGLGACGIRRYITILQLAEFLGDRSHCPKCQAYARFTLLHRCRPNPYKNIRVIALAQTQVRLDTEIVDPAPFTLNALSAGCATVNQSSHPNPQEAGHANAQPQHQPIRADV